MRAVVTVPFASWKLLKASSHDLFDIVLDFLQAVSKRPLPWVLCL